MSTGTTPARSSTLLKDESVGIKSEVGAALVQLQFQDRVSQIITAVESDMDRLVDASASAEALPPPEEWLARLEQTYTMESQRTGSDTDPGAPAPGAVEFF